LIGKVWICYFFDYVWSFS